MRIACLCVHTQMDRAQVLDSLDAATASNPGREEEIGALRGFVMTLAVDHESIRQAPPNPGAAVGYWQGMRGASCALVAPE